MESKIIQSNTLKEKRLGNLLKSLFESLENSIDSALNDLYSAETTREFKISAAKKQLFEKIIGQYKYAADKYKYNLNDCNFFRNNYSNLNKLAEIIVWKVTIEYLVFLYQFKNLDVITAHNSLFGLLYGFVAKRCQKEFNNNKEDYKEIDSALKGDVIANVSTEASIDIIKQILAYNVFTVESGPSPDKIPNAKLYQVPGKQTLISYLNAQFKAQTITQEDLNAIRDDLLYLEGQIKNGSRYVTKYDFEIVNKRTPAAAKKISEYPLDKYSALRSYFTQSTSAINAGTSLISYIDRFLTESIKKEISNQKKHTQLHCPRYDAQDNSINANEDDEVEEKAPFFSVDEKQNEEKLYRDYSLYGCLMAFLDGDEKALYLLKNLEENIRKHNEKIKKHQESFKQKVSNLTQRPVMEKLYQVFLEAKQAPGPENLKLRHCFFIFKKGLFEKKVNNHPFNLAEPQLKTIIDLSAESANTNRIKEAIANNDFNYNYFNRVSLTYFAQEFIPDYYKNYVSCWALIKNGKKEGQQQREMSYE